MSPHPLLVRFKPEEASPANLAALRTLGAVTMLGPDQYLLTVQYERELEAVRTLQAKWESTGCARFESFPQ